MIFQARQFLIPLYIFVCLLLGGSSTSSWPNMTLQLGAVVIAAWAALARPRFIAGRSGRQLAAVLLGMFALIGLQLIPLPPEVWSVLPARHYIVHGFRLLETPLPWLPLSVSPYATLASALWLLPALAVLAGVLRMDAYKEEWMALAVLMAALGGVVLGVLQLAHYGPAASGWYLYEISDIGAAVGFMAIANHTAILLVATIPFVFALFPATDRWRSSRRTRASAGKAAMLGGAMAAVSVGLALTYSRLGYFLAIVAFLSGAFVRFPVNGPRARWGLAAVGLGALFATAIIVSNPYQDDVPAKTVENESLSRSAVVKNSARAVSDYFPVGSGIGTFPNIYPAYENPERIGRRSVNHVHNDYVEVALETGLPGILLIGTFIIWWTQRAVTIWRASQVDPYPRAATIASASILLYSLADFPLRTIAVSVVFASCIAIMVGVRRLPKAASENGQTATGARHLSVDSA